MSSYTVYADNLDSRTIDVSYVQLNDGVSQLNVSAATFNMFNDSSTINMSINETTATFNVSDQSGIVTITGSAVTLSPSTTLNVSRGEGGSGDILTSQGPNKYPIWQSITEFLNIETGTVDLSGNDLTTKRVPFFARGDSDTYTVPPTVIITPGADTNGRIIPISLKNVSTGGFSVVFGSNKLRYFNYVVFPTTVDKYNSSSLIFNPDEDLDVSQNLVGINL